MSVKRIGRRSIFNLLSILIIAAFALAGCQAATPTPGAAEPAQPQPTQPEPAQPEPTQPEPAMGEVKITWLNHWGDPETAAYWREVADKFEAENAGIKIEIINSSFDDLLTTFMTQYGVGNSPDVFHVKYDLLPDLTAAGAIAAPSGAVQEEIQAGWSAAGVEGLMRDGTVWGYPTEIGVRGLMYNEKLLQEAGAELPTSPQGYTFEQYAEMARLVTEKTGVKGAGFIIQYEASLVENFTNFLWNNGGEFINEDQTQVTFNSPEGVEVLQLWKEMIDSGAVTLHNTDDMASALATEAVATYIDANWWKLMFFDTYDELNGEGAAQQTFKVSGVPWTKENHSRAFVFGLVVSSQSKHPEEAWKWAQYIAAPRGEAISYMAEFLTTFWGIIPSNKFDQQHAPVLVEEPYTRAYVEILNNFGRIQPVFKGYLEIQHILAGEIEKVFQTGKDPQAALDDAAAAANDVLAK